MSKVHDLLAQKGKEEVLASGESRDVVEAAAAYMSAEDNQNGYLYSGWCQTALPHKRIPDGERWQVDHERLSLIVEPGFRMGPDREAIPVGVPYGSRARLILIYLQSEAIRTGTPEIELGRSLRQWLKRMGINTGGRDFAIVRDQADRIARCRLTFHIFAGQRRGLVNSTIVERAMFEPASFDDECQGNLFTETVTLSDAFFRELQKHPVPLEDAAVRAISNNSQAIDIYCWLAYRLHALNKATPMSWAAAKSQFGVGVGRMDVFRRRFVPNLKLALGVYPKAKVEIADDGLVLYPSAPPVLPRPI